MDGILEQIQSNTQKTSDGASMNTRCARGKRLVRRLPRSDVGQFRQSLLLMHRIPLQHLQDHSIFPLKDVDRFLRMKF